MSLIKAKWRFPLIINLNVNKKLLNLSKMKKVFLFACVAFALASCGNKAASNDEVKEDTVAVATDRKSVV